MSIATASTPLRLLVFHFLVPPLVPFPLRDTALCCGGWRTLAWDSGATWLRAAIAIHNPVSSNGTGLSFPHPAKTCTHAIMHAMHSLVGHAPECVVSHNSGQRWSSRTDDKAFSLRNIVCPRVDTSEDASRLHEAACCKHQGAASFGRLDHKHGRVKAAALAAGTHFHWIFVNFIVISGLCFYTVLLLVCNCYDMGNCTSYYSTSQQLQGGLEAPGDLLFLHAFPPTNPLSAHAHE